MYNNFNNGPTTVRIESRAYLKQLVFLLPSVPLHSLQTLTVLACQPAQCI